MMVSECESVYQCVFVLQKQCRVEGCPGGQASEADDV